MMTVNKRTLRMFALVAIGIALTDGLGLAQEKSNKIDFAAQIQPILARKCYSCHGPDLQEGGLRFDNRETVVGEAESGKHAVVCGQADSSELLRRVTSEIDDERMPPEGKR